MLIVTFLLILYIPSYGCVAYTCTVMSSLKHPTAVLYCLLRQMSVCVAASSVCRTAGMFVARISSLPIAVHSVPI